MDLLACNKPGQYRYANGCRCAECIRLNRERVARYRETGTNRVEFRQIADRIPTDTAWMDSGKCKGRTDLDFFPGRGEDDISQAARACCNGTDGQPVCPVKARCLEWALEVNERGTWGGLSERERRTMKRTRRLGAAS